MRKKKKFLARKRRTLDPSLVIDYKNPDVLKRFVTDRGKIIPRRISGATSEQQREITTAVKRARYLGLIAYCTAHRPERGFAGEMQMVAQTFSASTFRSRPKGDFRDRGERGDRDRDRDDSRFQDSEPKE